MVNLKFALELSLRKLLFLNLENFQLFLSMVVNGGCHRRICLPGKFFIMRIFAVVHWYHLLVVQNLTYRVLLGHQSLRSLLIQLDLGPRLVDGRLHYLLGQYWLDTPWLHQGLKPVLELDLSSVADLVTTALLLLGQRLNHLDGLLLPFLGVLCQLGDGDGLQHLGLGDPGTWFGSPTDFLLAHWEHLGGDTVLSQV